MSNHPQWKVYSSDGRYLAACFAAEDAAVLVSVHGNGAHVRWGHDKRQTYWVEGFDGNAGDSYDAAAQLMNSRLVDWERRRFSGVTIAPYQADKQSFG